MKKLITYLFSSLLLINFSYGQEIEWQNTIGGNGEDVLNAVQQVSDGGFILGGNSSSSISADKTENSIGGSDYWIIKTDATGNIQWQNTIGGSNDEDLRSISQTIDGGYICAGSSRSNITGDKTENNWDTTLQTLDYWLIKLDSLGNIQWQNTIGGSNDEVLRSIFQTTDGGYICAGSSKSNITGDKTENNWDTTLLTFDYWILKLDTGGNIIWQNTIGGNDYDLLESLFQTSDGGYICKSFSVPPEGI